MRFGTAHRRREQVTHARGGASPTLCDQHRFTKTGAGDDATVAGDDCHVAAHPTLVKTVSTGVTAIDATRRRPADEASPLVARRWGGETRGFATGSQ